MNREISIERLGLGCGVVLALWFGAAVLMTGVAHLALRGSSLDVLSWSILKSRITSVGVWAGATGGILAAIDWMMPVTTKTALKEAMVSVWVWLEEQKAGRFMTILQKTTAQRIFALLAHITIAVIVIMFLGQQVGYFKKWHVQMELGHPRLYGFQIWIDIGAVALSSWVFGWRIYPRLFAWIASSATVGKYLKRALGVYACFWILLGILLALQSPIFAVMSSKTNFEDPAASIRAIEAALGGKAVVIVLQAITATVGAPVMAGLIMLQTMVFCSVYWLAIVWFAMMVFRSVGYFIERILAGNNGPVLTVSALLVAVSSAVKILT